MVITFGEVYPVRIDEKQLEYRWRTFGANWEKVATGESYKRRIDALDACIASSADGTQIMVRKSDGEIDHVVIVGHQRMTAKSDEAQRLAKELEERS